MTVTITPIYAALLALLLLFLSARVISFRRNNRVSLGDNDDADLRTRIRAQGNCMEYAPIGVILLLMLELGGLPGWVIHGLGVMLVAGRVMHARGFVVQPMNFQLRTFGMALTLTQIGLSALVLLGAALI